MIESKDKYAGTVEAIDLAGSGLRVEFDWFGDRFGHHIFGVERGESVQLLSSVEGDPGERWPASPALQEFNDPYIVSDCNQGAVRLAVGAAGSVHWAMSVDVPEDMAIAGPALTFEVACRVRRNPKWLGSTYDLAEVDRVSCDFLRVNIESAVGSYRLQTFGKQDSPELDDCLLHAADDRFTLHCAAPNPLTPPATLRWKYRIEKRRLQNKSHES